MKRARMILISMAIVAAYGSTLFRDGKASVAAAVDITLVPVLGGLDNPVFVTHATDASNRLFVVEQPGRIKVLQADATVPTVFLNITSKVNFGGERGLLGLAFHPQFQQNRRFFVNYTREPDGATVIAEYHVSAQDPNVAEPAETVLLTIPQPFANHNGGMIAFGPEGYLYIGMGDGGSANDPGNRAQNIKELLGKMLRIDVDHPNGAQAYSSPPDNPFNGTAGRDEIFAVGLRNPFRFSFDRATGELYVGDVGQGSFEEIDKVTRGGNYGWRVMEGNHCNPSFNNGQCSTAGFTTPIAEYGHTQGRCSLTGGYVYRGTKGALPVGSYVFGDYCTGEIFLLDGGVESVLLDTDLNISSFGEDRDGEIYVVGLGGSVARIANPNGPLPSSIEITSALVRKKSDHALLQPVTVKKKGKKYQLVVSGEGFVDASVVVINDREVKTKLKTSDNGDSILVARLRGDTLSAPGLLIVEVVNPNGVRSNQLSIEIAPD